MQIMSYRSQLFASFDIAVQHHGPVEVSPFRVRHGLNNWMSNGSEL